MEATALSIGKSALNGALDYAKSAVAEEVALQLGVQLDKAFITDELEMMQGFLMEAHEERHRSKVIKIWVKKVRDVAYDIEDCLHDFVVRLQKQSWWRIPRTLLDRRHVAKQMKELRAKVEDVSQRNVRYRLINGGCKAAKLSDHSTSTGATIFGIDEAKRHAARQEPQSRLDLAQLILKKEALSSDQIGVIGVWGTSGTVGHTSIISEAYDNELVKVNFPCRAWVRVKHPFHRKEFVQSVAEQFRAATLEVVDVLPEEAEYGGCVNEKRYLIVLTDLSTIEEWHQIRICFPKNKLLNWVVVSTEHVEIASLCSGQESTASELKQVSTDQTIYAFYQQSSQDVTYSPKPASSPSLPYIAENEIQEDQYNVDVNGELIMQERLTRTKTMAGVLGEFQLVGREKEKSDIIGLILEEASTQQFQVIAVWGMGGLGKTTLIKDVYQSKEVSHMFGKHAFVTVLRPFKLEELLRTLAVQLNARKEAMDFAGDTQKKIALMGVEELTEVLGRLSEGSSCLIVLDDLSSTSEWDKILPSLLAMRNPSLVIVITTRREDIAKYCCKQTKRIRLLHGLEEKDARKLFTKKVFKKTIDLARQYPELVEPARQILKKCSGLPLAIVAIGGFLADQPSKTAVEWRKLNGHISAELEVNPKLEPIKTVLMKSYDGLPYYLKACFLYLSIFPENHKIRWRRLIRRWIAEGYSSEVQDKSAVEMAERYFVELIERSMILPTQQSVCSRNGVDSCQLHDLIRDISISKAMEENLVFRLEGGCSSNTHGAVRHLAISSNWDGDEIEFHSTVELSHIRSLTVFGEWRPFYISAKMRFLRVLDLEGTKGPNNRDLDHIGKLLHLRYLSIRGCDKITYLPDSVGNLRQLETLDIRETGIAMLPKTIIKLNKLHYFHAGRKSSWGGEEQNCYEKCQNILMVQCNLCKLFCACDSWNPKFGSRRRNVCAYVCCIYCPNIIRGIDELGVKVPRGTRKLKALRTLRYVHLAWRNAVIKEIKGLTGLRKLGVVGINKKNGLGFCSVISSLSRLESLSVLSGRDLNGCLDGMPTALENLRSLKLSGNLEKLPEWIKGLQNLVKLKIQYTSLSCNVAAMQALGNLQHLSILGLQESELKIDVLQFQIGLFKKLTVLDLCYKSMEIKLVEFEEESMPNLEMLNLQLVNNETAFSGLQFLQSIKEVRLAVVFLEWSPEFPKDMAWEERQEEAAKKTKLVKDKVREDLRIQLDRNKNRPVLKVE